MIRHDRTLVHVTFALGLLALLPLAAARPAAADDDGSYGYFRVVEGDATLLQAGGDREPAEINQPVLAGDRIWVSDRSRVEVVLSDRNILRLDGGSEVTLEQLAASPDRDDPATVIRVHDGNILLTVTTYSLGDQLPRVDTPNASIYPQDFGTYRITASQETFTELVVRRGKAEVVTDRGSEIVRADESAFIEGDRYADVEIEAAGSYDRLERWADQLEGEARYAGNDYLDDDLSYHAAPLARHGSWVTIEGRNYWRPRVDAGWRPYWQGRWRYTPAGLTWVSYEPWGWVPYHYGSWDYYPSYGWVWEPGRRWAPAWVYWYWGPNYAGWCPTGYYTRFYRHRYPYFRYGVYGWAGGGDWHGWNNWTFVRHDYFRGYRNGYRDGYKDGRWDGRRDHWDVRRYAVPVDELRRLGPLDRGVVTTDTRPLKPDTWEDPRRAIRVLTDHPTARRINGRDGSPELPDVTPFINRRPDLPTNVIRTVVPDDNGQTAERPRIAGRDNPRGGGGGVIPTDPSTDRPRIATRPRPDGGTPSPQSPGAEAPRVRVPRSSNPASPTRPDTGGVQPTERPRLGRPQPGEGGGAPRPQVRPDGGDRPQSRPEIRQPRVQPRDEDDAGGTAPRMRRPESNQGGGAPRPQVRPESRPDNDDSAPRVRRPESGDSGGSPRPSRPQVQPPPSYRDRDRDSGSTRQDSPRTYERPRSDERPRSYESPRDREPSRPRVQPPPSSSRQPEASPSRPQRREEARPSEPRRDNDDDRRSASPSRPSRQGGDGGDNDRPRVRERKPPQG